MTKPGLSLDERFWSKVLWDVPDDACWEWQASVGSHGYGQIMIDKKPRTAHTLSWELHHGPLGEGVCVLHKCDNRLCVNPAHLFLGDRTINSVDKWNKGRAYRKLEDAEVVAIRERAAQGEKQRDLANEFGVAETHISTIVYGRCWPELGGPIRQRRV